MAYKRGIEYLICFIIIASISGKYCLFFGGKMVFLTNNPFNNNIPDRANDKLYLLTILLYYNNIIIMIVGLYRVEYQCKFSNALHSTPDLSICILTAIT